MGTPLGPKYIPYTYMDPLGNTLLTQTINYATVPMRFDTKKKTLRFPIKLGLNARVSPTGV